MREEVKQILETIKNRVEVVPVSGDGPTEILYKGRVMFNGFKFQSRDFHTTKGSAINAALQEVQLYIEEAIRKKEESVQKASASELLEQDRTAMDKLLSSITQ